MITRLTLRLGRLGASSPRLLAPSRSTLHLLHRALYSSTATATSPSPRRQTTPPPAPPSSIWKDLPPYYPLSLVNPPATTRPPPLFIPPPNPNDSKILQLFRTGKAFLTFYKTGLGQILTNRRLLFSPNPPSRPPPEGSRAHRQLLSRYRHDRNRLAPFGLLLLVCGELTPLVVLLFPRLVPYTCRIPRQVARLEEEHDARRRFETETVGKRHNPDEIMVVAETPRWISEFLRVMRPVTGPVTPGREVFRARVRMRWVMEDDQFLRPAGAVEALVEEEVRLAAMERGLLVRGVAEDVLRARLRAWMNCTRPNVMGPYFDLLLRGEGELVRRGALPEAACVRCSVQG